LSWNSTGSIDAVSIVLEETTSGSSVILHPIAMRIPNSGTYSWDIPEDLEPGTYYLRVVYSPTEFGRSGVFTKTTPVEETCERDCHGHGVCDSDSSYLCHCGYGWSGENCTAEPTGVERHRTAIGVKSAYSAYASDPAAFKALFRNDVSNSLGLVLDQIEVVSVAAQGSSDAMVVTFDVVLGNMFETSPFITNTTVDAAISQQLESESSALNHGVMDYETTETVTQINAATSITSPSLSISLFVLLSSCIASIVQFLMHMPSSN